MQRFEADRIEALHEGDGLVPDGVAEQIELARVTGDHHGGRRSQPGHDLELIAWPEAQGYPPLRDLES